MSYTKKLFDSLLAEQAEFVKRQRAQVNVSGGVGIMAMYHASPEEFERLTHDLETGKGLTPVERQSDKKGYYESRSVIDV